MAWYSRALGLRIHSRKPGTAELGDGAETVVVLREDGEARPAGRTAGLFHFALLYPSRKELARAAVRLAATGTPIQGASDHGTHEALYLSDIDGNGVELAADRPREQWPAGLGYDRGPAPLDFDALLGTLEGDELTPYVSEGVRMGHLHLHVGDIEQGIAFYRDVLGFEVQANLGTAAFVAAGGYHHHLGINVWNGWASARRPLTPPDSASGRSQLPCADGAEVRTRAEAAGVAVRPTDGGFSSATRGRPLWAS